MYRFVDDVTVADIAFEATGRDLPELLRDAGLAVTATMVSDVASVEPREERRLEVAGKDPEQLLHRFLSEVVYYKDAELLLFSAFDVEVRHEPGGRFEARVVARGEKLDATRHEQVVDVKAVTWHRFAVEGVPAGWRAFVVLDI